MEELFISHQSLHSDFDAVIYESTFPYLYLDLACKELCFPPGKAINRKSESTRGTIVDSQVLLLTLYTDDNIQ